MVTKVLVANRGAVASRVLRALNEMRLGSVAVYSDADADMPYLAEAGEAYPLGAAPARESYLNVERLIEIARAAKVDAVHPGYGFLAENPDFARRVRAAGMVFIGPNPDVIEAMGHKTKARDLVARYGMPVGAGSGILPSDPTAAAAVAERIGYPLLVKPALGGGGIGMIVARSSMELPATIERARSMAMRGFGNGDIYLERLLERPRHIEIQVLGDQTGCVKHLFERDCSVQRRHQKVIEEATAPGLSRTTMEILCDRVTRTLEQIGYDNIGTVEMLMAADGEFHFLEMNTRLQVEHAVTEEVTGIDLVKAQIRAAAGELVSEVVPQVVQPTGHAIQARIYAEDPIRFLPSPGPLEVFRPPSGEGIRVETGYAEGGQITPYYDPLLAKVIARGPTREAAIDRLEKALEAFEIRGVNHNIPALLRILRSEIFRAGAVHTGLLSEIRLT